MKGKMIIAGGLMGLTALCMRLDADHSKHYKEPVTVVQEVVYRGRNITVTSIESDFERNLKLQGIGDDGTLRSLYVFDHNKDGVVDHIAFDIYRHIVGSPFYGMTDREISNYLN
jgi:hypothetical protein